jgi:glycosyltransferase involved in cell wall biosynthesis
MVAPMPPSEDAPGAIPRLLHAAVTGLAAHHDLTLVAVAGPDPWELEAADRLGRSGLDVHTVRRHEPGTFRARWERRARLAWGWGGRRVPWRTAWFHDPRVQNILDGLAASRRFDVVAAEDDAVGLYRYPAGVPAVLTEHEVRRPRARRPLGRPGRGWVRRALEESDWQRWPRYQRTVWSRFTIVQAFTERDAAEIAAAVPALRGRVRVTPFGVELPPPADPASEEPGEVLFVGNMTHHPNVDAALWLGREVMPLLRAGHPGVRLTIAGTAPPPEVLALAAPDVAVPGWVRDLRPLLERARVVVAPIRVGGGMRMKVLESMAFGKAVVTTPRGAEGLDVAGERAPLAVAADAEALAQETLRLLEDDTGRRDLGRRARSFVERHHGGGAYARRLEAVYREAVELTPAPAGA